jgi:hypothetical protein
MCSRARLHLVSTSISSPSLTESQESLVIGRVPGVSHCSVICIPMTRPQTNRVTACEHTPCMPRSRITACQRTPCMPANMRTELRVASSEDSELAWFGRFGRFGILGSHVCLFACSRTASCRFTAVDVELGRRRSSSHRRLWGRLRRWRRLWLSRRRQRRCVLTGAVCGLPHAS